jgi:hypothetical protein
MIETTDNDQKNGCARHRRVLGCPPISGWGHLQITEVFPGPSPPIFQPQRKDLWRRLDIPEGVCPRSLRFRPLLRVEQRRIGLDWTTFSASPMRNCGALLPR